MTEKMEVEITDSETLVQLLKDDQLWLSARFDSEEYLASLSPETPWEGLLPPNIIGINPNLSRVVMYEPARFRNLNIVGKDMFPGLYRLGMPPLIYSLSWYSSGGYQVEELMLAPHFALGTAYGMGPVPIPNLYEDGRVCRPVLSAPTSDRGTSMVWAIDEFWSSEFNDEVPDFRKNSMYTLFCAHGNPWQYWESLDLAIVCALDYPLPWTPSVINKFLNSSIGEAKTTGGWLRSWLWPPLPTLTEPA